MKITLHSIDKAFGGRDIFSDFTLEIPSGARLVIVGPNGAGKTTLIRILTGIIKPTAGQVFVGPFDLYAQPDQAKALLGYVPDRPYLYEKLTPLEYFDFMGGLYNVKPARILEKGEEMLKLFHLWDRRHELIESFSHGMKQKVAMSAAILHDPEIFVVDEPTVGLDPRSVKLAKDYFRRLADEGKTVFLTTHTLSVAEDLCDRIAIIRNGDIVALGNLDELQQKASLPGNDLEAVFLKITEEEQAVTIQSQ